MCFEFSFKSSQCLLAPIPPPASWSGAVISLDGEQQTHLGVVCGEQLGLGIISGFCYLPAACRPIGGGGAPSCGSWGYPGGQSAAHGPGSLLAEWARLCCLTSVSLGGLVREMGPRCISSPRRLNKISPHSLARRGGLLAWAPLPFGGVG